MHTTLILIIIAVFLTSSLTMAEHVDSKEIVLTVPDRFPTINKAIQNAIDGDTILIKQGIYNETVIIDKAITLRGEDTNKTIIKGDGNGTVIQILHDNITITGLTVTYSSVPNTPRRYYQHYLPQGWLPATQNGWSGIGWPLDGGYFIRNSDFRLAGIHIQNAKNCVISGNKISDCGVGIWLWEASNNFVGGNILVKNDYAIQVESSGYDTLFGNTFLNNGGGIWLPQPNWVSGLGIDAKTVNNTFTQNNFLDNQKAIEPQSLTLTTNFWDNGTVGNYWMFNNGTDSNQDGIVEVPYKIMGEYYTGGYHQHGFWKEQTCSVDNYPLAQPFDTVSMFVVHKVPAPSQQSSTNCKMDTLMLTVVTAVFAALTVIAIAITRKRKGKRLAQKRTSNPLQTQKLKRHASPKLYHNRTITQWQTQQRQAGPN